MKIGIKLTIAFFGIAFAASLLVGLIAYVRSKDALERESFNKLTAVREMKANQIEDYYGQITDHVQVFSEDPTVVSAMKRLRRGYDSISIQLHPDEKKIAELDQTLQGYFELQYLTRLNPNLDKKTTALEEMPAGRNARLLQYLCIVSNPNPVGEKYKLDSLPARAGDMAVDSTTYARAHARFHPFLRDYLERFGFYDIFLVDDSTGNIVYTVFKEVDFGTSLLNGPFSNTNIGEAFRAVHNSPGHDVKLVDFAPYHPSYNAPAAFIASPIFDGKKKIGALIFQMPIDRINDVMTSKQQWRKVGLGSTGETYIVGDDFTLRNQSRFLIEDSVNYLKMIRAIGIPPATVEKIRGFKSSIGLQTVRTEGTKAALDGKTDSRIFPDYRGVPVLSSYRPLNIAGMHWVIMSEIDEAEAFAEVQALRNYLIYGFLGMLLLIVVVSIIISRRITNPIKLLSNDAMEVAKGNFNVEINIRRKDEIGILALSFRKMQSSIKRLIDELRDINLGLEQKVAERTQEIHQQKETLEEKNKEILDSINYAQRLQHAILPATERIQQLFPDSFIVFKPKDIVSGDFYWMYEDGDEIWLAVVDCTGHGVPGAMVSMVGANSLNRCVSEFKLRKPAEILDKLTALVVETFETNTHEVRDGMDICLCRIHRRTLKIEYAGANNALWIIRAGEEEIEEIRADKQPIGKYEFGKAFTHHEVQLAAGDSIYLFTDGYADQFGGPRGKKFKYKTMLGSVAALSRQPMEAQGKALDQQFEEWRGNLEQVDDVCVMGVRLG